MVDITKDFDPTTFDTSNYELDASLPKEKNKKVIGLMKHELDGKIIKKKLLRAKTYRYLTDNNDADKKAKVTKICVIRIKITFGKYKYCLKAIKLKNKTKQLEKKANADSLQKDHKELITTIN